MKKLLQSALQAFKKIRKLPFGELKTMFELLRLNMMPREQDEQLTQTIGDYFREYKDILLANISDIESKCTKVQKRMQIKLLS